MSNQTAVEVAEIIQRHWHHFKHLCEQIIIVCMRHQM